MTIGSRFVLIGLLTSLVAIGGPLLFPSVLAEPISTDRYLIPAQYYGGSYGTECIDPVTGYPCY
jgi:hypothetical protein